RPRSRPVAQRQALPRALDERAGGLARHAARAAAGSALLGLHFAAAAAPRAPRPLPGPARRARRRARAPHAGERAPQRPSVGAPRGIDRGADSSRRQPVLREPFGMALLEIRNVTRRFGPLTAVDNVSLAVEAGEFFTLLGPSGCGKTTLLRMIAGFDLPDSGRIRLDGKDLARRPPEERPVRTVFQSYALFPHMTVEGNIAFPLEMSRTPASEMRGKIDE